MNIITKNWYKDATTSGEEALLRRWLDWRLLLLPLSYLYQLGFNIHKLLYKLSLKKIYHSPVPVIVIGNITVGGTGKTPFTIALAHVLKSQGYQPGIISRGYGGKHNKKATSVNEKSDPNLVGDEPVLIARKTTCPIVVAINRSVAIKKLLSEHQCNVLILDDGLQHHAIKKDIEIVLVDAKRKFGNGHCLPAGPLRESVKKLSKVDFVVFNGDTDYPYQMHLNAENIYNLILPNLKFDQEVYAKKMIHAVAGIGNPQRFFKSLDDMSLKFVPHCFPDHHIFTLKDFELFEPDSIIIMTEKDAVKCQPFADQRFWVLPVKAQINATFMTDFLKQLSSILPIANSN